VIKEEFRWFWRYVYSTSAEEFFSQWYAWRMRSRLRPVVRVEKMLKRHLPNLRNYFLYRIMNATSEGFNGVIQALKYTARGFMSFKNYRTRSCSSAESSTSDRSCLAIEMPENRFV